MMFVLFDDERSEKRIVIISGNAITKERIRCRCGSSGENDVNILKANSEGPLLTSNHIHVFCSLMLLIKGLRQMNHSTGIVSKKRKATCFS